MLLAFLDGLSVLSEKWTVVLGIVAILGTVTGLILLISWKITDGEQKFWRIGLAPGFFFIIALILRLAFLKDIYVPPYFDSVEHYRVTTELVGALETSTLPETLPALTPDYYHLGFHFLASLLTLGLHADPMDVILVLGQVLLAAIPIPVYFLLRSSTGSGTAAFFSMLLAGFGWYMPGFSVNWGKYPALTGLLALEILLSITYLFNDSWRRGRRERIFLFCLFILGSIISAFFHTRTVILIAISIASWFGAGKLQSPPMSVRGTPVPKQFILPGILLACLVVFGFLAKREPLLNLTLEPYLGAGLWVTLTVLGLSPFALTRFPREAYFSLLFAFLSFVALFVPVPAWSPALANQTLLDRPFVEILLYLPLSILGGLGLAGLLQLTKKVYETPGGDHLEHQREIFSMPERRFLLAKFILRITEGLVEITRKYVPLKSGFCKVAQALIAILLAGFTGLLLMNRYDLYPSDCCQLVGYDDTVALDWIGRNLPPDARILIAATQLNVLPSGPSAGLVGTDAGVWIPTLTGRTILMTPFDTDFRSEITLEQSCQSQVGYIYVGNTSQKFDGTQLQAKENWYKAVLFLPNTQLYQLTGCDW